MAFSDADIGLTDEDIGIEPASQGMSDADIGLSDSDIGLVEAEGPLMSGVREAAHAVLPAIGSIVGMAPGVAAGTAAGALTSPVTGPVGPVVGGFGGAVAGAIAGGAATQYAQDKALKAVGFDDDAQRQANLEANPWAARIGGIVPSAATLSPSITAPVVRAIGARTAEKAVGNVGEQIAVRATSGAFSGAVSAGGGLVTEGEIDPRNVALDTALGVAMPSFNRAGQALYRQGERFVPGRPNKPANTDPEAQQAHDDVGDDMDINDTEMGQSAVQPTTAATAGAAPEAPPSAPPATGATTGNPQSAPVRSKRQYKKGKPAAPPESTVTEGQMDPATIAAIRDPNSQPVHEPPPATAENVDQSIAVNLNDNARLPEGMASPADQVRAEIERLRAENQQLREPSVEAGFPQPGEPVAVGANEATPLPPGTPERAAKAIARSKAKQKPVTAAVTEAAMPEFKGETNPAPTEGQAGAGNYAKEKSYDFGKPLRKETVAGGMRTGKNPDGTEWKHKSPYDYGYFNKTKGKDKEHIDWARPHRDDVEHLGSKHFVIDQRDADTGAFDEHKLFTYYKDEAAARDHYLKGFGDGKGPDRLGAITEATAADVSKFLMKHTLRAATQPYNKAGFEVEQGTRDLRKAMGRDPNTGKPKAERASAGIGEPKVVTKAREMMVAQGLPEAHIKFFDGMPASERAAAATKFVASAVNKTGKVAATAKTARIRPKPAEVPGAPGITARSKADAQKKGDALTRMNAAMEKNAPVEGETHEALRARLQKIVEEAGTSLDDYKPSVKPAAYQLVRHAKQMLALKKGWTEKKVTEFNANEMKLRSGNKDDIDDVRATNRIEADIARSRRSGDDAIASAEAEAAVTRNTVEDDMLAAIDAKRGGKFDVPHEEAEAMVEPKPVRTKADLIKKAAKKVVDINDTEIAKIDTKPLDAAAAKRKAEAAAFVSKTAGKPYKERVGEKANDGRNIQTIDKTEMDRILKAANLAAERGARLASEEKSGARDLFERFAGDERGAFGAGRAPVDWSKVKSGIQASLKRTKHDSYIAKTSKVPHSEYVRSLDEDLHRDDLADDGHKADNRERWKALPKELVDPKTGKATPLSEKLYLMREQGKLHALTPEERAIYDEHIKPILDENEVFADAIRQLDERMIGPKVVNHISRIAKNEDIARMFAQSDDPTAPRTHTIVTKADAAETRTFVALERVSDGKRFVISPSDKGGFTFWNHYKKATHKDSSFEFEAGKPYTFVNSKTKAKIDYIMRDAFTPEIEANALGEDKKPMRYYKNVALSALVANTQLGAMARQLGTLHRIANTPEFKKLTAKVGSDKAKRHPDWEESRLKGPLFNGLVMDPHLRYVFDDYVKAGFDSPEALRRLSQGVTKLLFWTPVAHIANVGVHWWTARGWDWVTPQGWYSLIVDGADAIKSVITQDDFQKQLRDAGAGVILPSVYNRRFMEQLFKGVGEDVKRRPSEWRPIFKAMGLSDSIQDVLGTPINFIDKYVYDNSAKLMWASNDVFITQRVKELMRKGMSMKDAIVDAERDIPNYRVPTTLITEGKWGRYAQQFATSPELLAFGRYHSGVFTSFAHIMKGLLGAQATLGDRFEAAGKLFAMALMAFVAYPIMDAAVKLLTGNKEARSHRRGPLAVTSHIQDSLEGKADVMKAMRSTTTVPPMLSTVIETLANRDFRGKQIVEPGDVRRGAQGHLPSAARAVGSFVEHKAKGLISPYGTLANADKKDIGPLGAVRDALLDAKNPSPKGVRYEKMIPILTERDARARFKRGGSGPLEKAINKTLGY